MTAIGNAPVSYGAFEVTVGHDDDVPDAVQVLDAVQAAGYEGIDLGPLGYLGLGDELRDALRSRGLLLTGGYVEIDVTSDEASRRGLAELSDVCDQFDAVRDGVDRVLLPRPTVALIAPASAGPEEPAVRRARTDLEFSFIEPRSDRLADALFAKIPAGVGSEGAIPGLSIDELKKLVSEGARWAQSNGYATRQDLEHTEEGGRLAGADPDSVSEHAYKRGARQMGTLGSGNHFIEVSHIDRIYDDKLAAAMDLHQGQVTVLIHSGSRGLGHQTCDDYLKVAGAAMARYGISLPDRQLAAFPIRSPEGQAYLGAMAAAANFAWCNRQVMMHLAEQAFIEALSIAPRALNFALLYDACHNIAKFEEHIVDGRKRPVCVHRKGATRAFGAGNAALPDALRPLGQPSSSRVTWAVTRLC